MAKRARSTRPEMPRRSERFLTSAMTCPAGDVVDVSKDGFRLASSKKFSFRVGETHQVVLRAGAQQVRVAGRVQWIRRVSVFPVRYQAGLLIVDPRPGVGTAVLQLGQFGCAGTATDSVDAATAAEAGEQAKPKIDASIEYEDLYGVLGVASDATQDEIKRAYRVLARRHHPDHSDAPDAEDVFDQIAKAYQVLGDARRRKWYDQLVSGELAA